MYTHIQKVLKVSLCMILLASPFSAWAKVDQFKFSSYITEISQDDGELGIIKVSLHAATLPLIINGDTEIRSGGDEIGIDQLSIGDFVKVDAFFAVEGIVAEEVEVLDERNEQFRLRGRVSSVSELDGNTYIELLGLEVRIDDSANVTRRGSGFGNAVDAADIIAGDEVNVRGTFENGELLVTNIHVGSREQGDIELEGEVADLTDDAFKLLLDSGVSLAVVMDADTEVSGTLADGVLVEMEGRFNENLSILAFEVAVDEDGDGDADDDNRRRGRSNDKNKDKSNNGNGNDNDDDDDSDNDESGVEVGRETALSGEGTDISGKAEFKYEDEDGNIEQKVEVEIEDAPADTEFSILVFFGDSETGIDFGSFTSNAEGEGKAEAKTDANDDDEQDLGSLLPEGSDVRDITVIQILQDGVVVVTGEF